MPFPKSNPEPQSQSPKAPEQQRVVVAEETALAAEISAAHVEVAVERAEADEVAAVKAADKATPACPHCGRRLRAEHDLGDHLHCDSSACIGCCFDPGPVLRANHPACPAVAGR